MCEKRTTRIAPLSGNDVYDGEFSKRAPILRNAAQHLESISGFRIALKFDVDFICPKDTNI